MKKLLIFLAFLPAICFAQLDSIVSAIITVDQENCIDLTMPADKSVCSDSTFNIAVVTNGYPSDSLLMEGNFTFTDATNDTTDATPNAQAITDGGDYVTVSYWNAGLLADIDSFYVEVIDCVGDLIAWYPLDANVNDSSYYGNDATNYGATRGYDRYGDLKAYTFEAGDSISIPYQAYNNVSQMTDGFTIMAWIYPTDISADRRIIGNFDVLNQFLIKIESDNGSIKFAVHDAGTQLSQSTASSIIIDTWYHVIGMSRNDSLLIFIDSKQDMSIRDTHGSINNVTSQLINIGGSNGESFVGTIDDVKIYSRSFTDLQIDSIFNDFPPLTLDTLIYPGAMGFGTQSRAAYDTTTVTNPVVLIVDTLLAGIYNSSDTTGSFEWALTRNYPRIVIFSVNGVIDYTADATPYFDVDDPYLSVYGQTAEGNGITVLGCEIYVESHDILFQHIKFRQYDQNANRLVGRCIGVVTPSYNVVFDHCSFSFANDEIFTIWNADYNITLSNSIVSFPLNESHHESESGVRVPEQHGYSVIDQADSCVAYIGNLFAYGTARFPLSGNDKGLIQNNMNYSADQMSIAGPFLRDGGANRKYIIKGNKFLPRITNVAWIKRSVHLDGSSFSEDAQVWVEDNISQIKIENPTYTEWECIYNYPGCTEPATIPFDTTDFPSISSDSVEAHVMAYAGAFYWDRDWIDQMAVDSVTARSFNFINSADSLPARAYNRGIYEGLETTDGNMQNGYDFSADNVSFTVNGTTINLTTNLTSQAQVLSAINSQLPAGTEAIDHPNTSCYHIIIQTEDTGSDQSIIIGGDASVFGIANGTYYGEDGIGGYPTFTKADATWTYPADPHGDDNSNGYTNLEDWVNSMTE